MKLGITNLLTAGAARTPSTEDANYPADNVLTPQRPFLPWRTTTVGSDQTLTIDYGAATSWGLVGIVNANYASVRIQAHATNSWGAPTHDSGVLTVSRNPWNWRYGITYIPVSAVNLRWMRILIPAQTPVDGAAYFNTGGIFVSALTTPPTQWRWNPSYRTINPRVDLGPEHGGWSARSRRGEPRFRVEARVHAETSLTIPGNGDGLDSWQEILRQIWGVTDFWLHFDTGDTSMGAMARLVEDPTWDVAAGLSTTSFIAEESVTTG